MKFREFEVEIKFDDGDEYLVISQKKANPFTGVITTAYVTLERHQLQSLLDALLIVDGK